MVSEVLWKGLRRWIGCVAMCVPVATQWYQASETTRHFGVCRTVYQ